MISVRQLIIDCKECGAICISPNNIVYDYYVVKKHVMSMNVSEHDFCTVFDSMVNEGTIIYYKPTTSDQYLESNTVYFYLATERYDG